MFKFLYSNFYDQLSKINPTTTTTTTPKSNATPNTNSSSQALNSGSKRKNSNSKEPLDLNKVDFDTALTCDMPDFMIIDSPLTTAKSAYNRFNSMSSPSNSSVSSNSSSYPSTYLNLSAPSYFSKGFAPKLPPKESPLNISKPRNITKAAPKPNLSRSNTLSPKTLSRRGSLSSIPTPVVAKPTPLNKLPEALNYLSKNHSFTNGQSPYRTNLNSNSDLNHSLNNSFQSLVHYGDNIGAKVVKCLINENLYESQSLINQDYDIYQVVIVFFI